MAGLQLVPNPAILAIQSGVFLSAIFIVKKLYVDPFVKLKAKRNAATTGNQDQASQLLAKNESDSADIKRKMAKASSDANAIIAAAKKSASEERDQIIAKASAEAKAKIEALNAEIAEKLKAEQAKIPSVVASISATVFERAMR